jgi:hypothetical protein
MFQYLLLNILLIMAQYLKLFKNHAEYDECDDKPTISHCIEETHIHKDNGYDYGSEDEDPVDYDLDAGYFE